MKEDVKEFRELAAQQRWRELALVLMYELSEALGVISEMETAKAHRRQMNLIHKQLRKKDDQV